MRRRAENARAPEGRRIGVWLQVLGSAAGGGFPQWNCACPGCRAVREGSRPARRRTQSSVAVSADQRRWFLLNASPDIRGQIESFPAAAPAARAGPRPTAGGAAHRRRARPHDRPAAVAGGAGSRRARHPRRVRDAVRRDRACCATLERYCRGQWQPVTPGVDVPSVTACPTGPSTSRPPSGHASAPGAERRPGGGLPAHRRAAADGPRSTCRACSG